MIIVVNWKMSDREETHTQNNNTNTYSYIFLNESRERKKLRFDRIRNKQFILYWFFSHTQLEKYISRNRGKEGFARWSTPFEIYKIGIWICFFSVSRSRFEGRCAGQRYTSNWNHRKISWSKCHSRSSFILLSLFSWMCVCMSVRACLCVCTSLRSFCFIDGLVAFFLSPFLPLTLSHSFSFTNNIFVLGAQC